MNNEKTDYEKAVKELWAWQDSNTGCFHNMLFTLIQKADPVNKSKLQELYPDEYQAWIDWSMAGDYGNDLFRKHGLMK